MCRTWPTAQHSLCHSKPDHLRLLVKNNFLPLPSATAVAAPRAVEDNNGIRLHVQLVGRDCSNGNRNLISRKNYSPRKEEDQKAKKKKTNNEDGKGEKVSSVGNFIITNEQQPQSPTTTSFIEAASASAFSPGRLPYICAIEESLKENRNPKSAFSFPYQNTGTSNRKEQQPAEKHFARSEPPPSHAAPPMPAGAGGGTNSPQHNQQQQGTSSGIGGQTGTTAGSVDVDLEQVLRSEIARAPFHQFLQQQFCAENINFYLAVEEYKKISETESDRRLDFGRQIYDRHFAANCIEPVNIDNSTSNHIREAYKSNRFTTDVYDIVQYQIFHLLKYDCWPRYLRAGGQPSEELGGDSKSHDSGASTSQSVVYNSKRSAPNNRRKSLFRFLRLQKGSDEEKGSKEENDHPCTCCKTPQPQRRRPLGTMNANSFANNNEDCINCAAAQRQQKQECDEEFHPPNRGDMMNRKARRSYAGTSALLWRDRRHCTCRCRGCGGKISPSEEFAEPKPDFPVRYCTLLCADSATSTEIALSDPFQSVRQWTSTMAEGCGLDKNASEVVDAQTGSTIDPVRQAVDALNNRVVRIMPVVKFPVVFLGPSASTSSKASTPLPAKAVVLRCRPALTVGKVLRPIMAKYNVETEQAVVCLAGTCDVLKLQTPVSSVYQKSLAVMTQQQFAERKLLPKREYQKELNIAPNWMLSPSGQSSPGGPESHQPPYHQHGDVSFCEIPLEPEGGKLGSGLLLIKHNATRSYSSNPREFFKFGRKPTMLTKGRGGAQQPETDPNSTVPEAAVGSHPSTSTIGTHLRYRKSGGSTMGAGRNSTSKDADRRKSLGAATAALPVNNVGTPTSGAGPEEARGSGGPRLSSAALAVGLVAPSDIPYCGEAELNEEQPPVQEVCTSYSVQSNMAKHESISFTKSAAFTGNSSRMECSSSHDELRSGANGQQQQSSSSSRQPCPIPALFTSTVRSDKDGRAGGGGGAGTTVSPSPSTDSGTMVWQKADYV